MSKSEDGTLPIIIQKIEDNLRGKVAAAVKELPLFNDEKEVLADYIENFNNTINSYGLDEVAACRILPLKLQGRSKKAYNTH